MLHEMLVVGIREFGRTPKWIIRLCFQSGLCHQDTFDLKTRVKQQDVILLLMSGGTAHLDTWDPRMEAMQEIRGELWAIDTLIPGVQFCEILLQYARNTEQFALIRSLMNHVSGQTSSQTFYWRFDNNRSY